MVYVYNGILAIRNDKYTPFASTWMVVDGKGERRKNEWEISERETQHERLLTLGNELEVVEREVGGGLG